MNYFQSAELRCAITTEFYVHGLYDPAPSKGRGMGFELQILVLCRCRCKNSIFILITIKEIINCKKNRYKMILNNNSYLVERDLQNNFPVILYLHITFHLVSRSADTL